MCALVLRSAKSGSNYVCWRYDPVGVILGVVVSCRYRQYRGFDAADYVSVLEETRGRRLATPKR